VGPRSRRSAAVGAILFFLVAPGTVAGLLPYAMTGGWRPGRDLSLPARIVGVLLVASGLLSLVESFARFVTKGLGTPAPVAPPVELVVSGQYRFVRNPMYVALVSIVTGEALWLGQLGLFAYALLLFLLFHLRVLLFEEPTLRRLFDGAYERYCAEVPRWLPRPPGRARGR